jgi:hypothetical protein
LSMRIIVFDPFPDKLLFINVKNSVDGKRKKCFFWSEKCLQYKYRPFTKRYMSLKAVDIIN